MKKTTIVTVIQRIDISISKNDMFAPLLIFFRGIFVYFAVVAREPRREVKYTNRPKSVIETLQIFSRFEPKGT